jgi:RIP metalloprotease RseP
MAGVVFNMILAGVIYSVAYMLSTPSRVSADGPVAMAGLRDGDSLLTINGHAIDHTNGDTVSTTVHEAADSTQGKQVAITYRSSNNATHSATLTPVLGANNGQVSPDPCGGNALPEGDSFITKVDGKPVQSGDAVSILSRAHTVDGVAHGDPCNGTRFTGRTVPSGIGGWNDKGSKVVASWRVGMTLDFDGKSPTAAIAAGWGEIPRFFSDEYSGLKELFTDPNSGGPLGANGFEGPIGIGAQSVAAAQSGLQTYLFLVGLISMNLALINMLPIPFLDGGKALIVAIEGVRRRSLNPRRELAIYAAGAAFLVVFALYVTIGDIRRIFH